MAKEFKKEEDFEAFYSAFKDYDLNKEIGNINLQFARIFPNENKVISIIDTKLKREGPAALGRGLDILYKGGLVDPRGMKSLFEKHTAFSPEELIEREQNFINGIKVGVVSQKGDIKDVSKNPHENYKIEKSEALIKDLSKYLGQGRESMGTNVEESKILAQFVVAHELAHIYYKDNYKTYSEDLPPNFKAITVDKGIFRSFKVADMINEIQADALAFAVVKKMNYNNPNFDGFFEKLITSRLEQSVGESQNGKFMDSHRFYELYKNNGEFLKKNASNINNTNDVVGLLKKIEKLAETELKKGGINIQADEQHVFNVNHKNSDLIKNRLEQEKIDFDKTFSTDKGRDEWFKSVSQKTHNFDGKKESIYVRNFEERQIIDKNKITKIDEDYLNKLPTSFEKNTPISDGHIEELYNRILDKRESHNSSEINHSMNENIILNSTKFNY